MRGCRCRASSPDAGSLHTEECVVQLGKRSSKGTTVENPSAVEAGPDRFGEEAFWQAVGLQADPQPLVDGTLQPQAFASEREQVMFGERMSGNRLDQRQQPVKGERAGRGAGVRADDQGVQRAPQNDQLRCALRVDRPDGCGTSRPSLRASGKQCGWPRSASKSRSCSQMS